MIATRHLLGLMLLCLPLSVAVAGDGYPDLRERFDVRLQAGLESTLRHTGLMSAVERKELSVALVDITTLRRPRVAAVNGDEMFYAASLPKIAILLGAFVQAERGRLRLDDSTRDTLTDMIRVSSNQAATQMLRKVGKQELASILQSPRYRLYDPAQNGGLWVGKEYAHEGRWRRDPLHNISHGATALQTARFYYMLETNQLASPQHCREMKEMLSRPAINHKFVKGLMQTHPDSKIYRKSGTWKRWHADSAIVERDGHKYILVALAENPEGGHWLTRLAIAVDNLVIPERLAKLN
jgi:beta-lactamase class A